MSWTVAPEFRTHIHILVEWKKIDFILATEISKEEGKQILGISDFRCLFPVALQLTQDEDTSSASWTIGRPALLLTHGSVRKASRIGELTVCIGLE